MNRWVVLIHYKGITTCLTLHCQPKKISLSAYGGSDTNAIRELQAVSRNINQIAKRANATGTVYEQDIEDIKKAVDEIWRLQRRTLLNQP